MKTAQAWRLGMKDMQILPAPRQRSNLKKPTWIIVLVSLVSVFLVCAYVYPPRNSSACYVFSSRSCSAFTDWLPPAPARELTVEEGMKIDFLFMFMHLGKKPVHSRRFFINREIRSEKWFTMKRQHALIITADRLYYELFRDFCKPNMEGSKNCYSDEHYLPTFFHMLDPAGIANWSVTHVDWSEGKWHPKSYKAEDISDELVRNITSITESVHVTSEEKKEIQIQPCLWNGERRPCYLFARKFLPESLDNLMVLFSNNTTI